MLVEPPLICEVVQADLEQTHGVIEVVDAQSFWQCLDACYRDPMSVSTRDICNLYLALAIGALMRPGSFAAPDEPASKPAGKVSEERAQSLFEAAKAMVHGWSGLDDADMWSVQALTLLAVYHLTLSKRNSAEAYHGTSKPPELIGMQ